MITKKQISAIATPWVTLTDSATVTIDASTGNNFQITLGGNRTFANPANPTDGQTLILKIKQSPLLGTITWGNAFRFSTLGTPVLSITGGKNDYVTFVYNSTEGFWDNIAYSKGF